MNPRLFLAIRPPHDVRAILREAMDGVAGARWQDDDQLHLTLRFIGETDFRQAEDLAMALDDVRFPAFPLRIAGTGMFERKGRPHTLWARVEPSDPLVRLQRKLERACVVADFAPERRRFCPHITLARLSATSGPIGDFHVRKAALVSPAWTVREFVLYESRLGGEGATYTPLAEWPLLG